MVLTKFRLNLVLLWLLLQMDDYPNLDGRVAFSSNGETIELWLIRASHPLFVTGCQDGPRTGSLYLPSAERRRTSTMFPSGYRAVSLSSSTTICLMRVENLRAGFRSFALWLDNCTGEEH